jgi:ribonuclease Z
MKTNLTRRELLKLSGLTLGTVVASNALAPVDTALGASLGKDRQSSDSPQQPEEPSFLPGEKLAENEMRITFMGTCFIPRLKQEANSVFVEVGSGDSFIFDCGSGVTSKYVACGVPYSRMDKIFLTHLHADHASDLSFIYCFGPSTDRKTPLYVWGPSGDRPEEGTQFFCNKMKEMMKWHIESFSFLPTGLAQGGDGYDIVVHECPYMTVGGTAYDRNGVKITHFPAVHARNGSISYKLEWNGLSMVFTGDTMPNKYVIDQAKGVDVLIHEMTVPPEIWATKMSGLQRGDPGYEFAVAYSKAVQNSSHTPQLALGYILSKTKPRLGVATHFTANPENLKPAMEDIRYWYDGPVTIAVDLLVINVSKNQIRQRRATVSDYAWYPVGKIYSEKELAKPKYPSPTAQLNGELLANIIPQDVYNRSRK